MKQMSPFVSGSGILKTSNGKPANYSVLTSSDEHNVHSSATAH